MNPPGNDVLYEMIRTIKEEQLPSLHDEMSRGFGSLNGEASELKRCSEKNRSDIDSIQRSIVVREGQLGVWKWIISAIGLSAILQWIYDTRI